MEKKRKIVLRKEANVFYDPTKRYPRIYVPSAFVKALGIAHQIKTVFITLYSDRTITIEKAEET